MKNVCVWLMLLCVSLKAYPATVDKELLEKSVKRDYLPTGEVPQTYCDDLKGQMEALFQEFCSSHAEVPDCLKIAREFVAVELYTKNGC